MPAQGFAIERRDATVCVSGELRIGDGAAIWRALESALEPPAPELSVDLSRATGIDATIVGMLVDWQVELAARGVRIDLVGASDAAAQLIAVHSGYSAAQPPKGSPPGMLELLGDTVRGAGQGARAATEFVGDTVTGMVGAVRRPRTADWASTLPLVARAGADAVPLVLGLNFLLGFVMGYESSRQLERYGAERFIADVVGVAVTRELSPVMTSIIVVGRSAAAYAAELGTMKVSDEIDALRTMGFVPVRQLVVPRLVALAIVTPLLTLLGDVSGVAGGIVVGITRLGVGVDVFMAELRAAIGLSDLFSGVVKATFAGLTIAVISAEQGLRASGGPAAVGSRTTATVVRSLVAIVFIDASFALLLRAVGT